MNNSFSIAKRLRSFMYALRGLGRFLKEEHNAWLHLAATIAVAIGGVYFQATATEWIALAIVTGLVWVAEAFNTVIERSMDLLSPGQNPQVAFIKDLAAGAVLLAAGTAVIVGCIIFIPKIL